MIPLLFGVTALAAFQLNTDIFWLDEEFSIFMSGGAQFGPVSFLEIIVRVGDHAWPPLHNLMLVGWSWLFGWSAFATRLMSLYFGLLTIAMLYRVGTDLHSRQVGLVTALLGGSSAFLIHYMHEGRGYTLYAFLTLVGVWAYWRLVTGPMGKRARPVQMLFLLSMVAMLYTHYIAATLPAMLALHHLLFVPRSKRWHQIFRLFFYALILFIPWSLIAILAVRAESTVTRGLGAFEAIQASLYGYSNGLWFLLLALLVYLALTVRHKHLRLIGFWLGATFVMALIFNIFTEFLFHIRHIIVILPPVLLLLAIAIVTLSRRRRWLGVGLTGVWIIAGAWGYLGDDFIMALPGQEDTLPRAPMHAAFDLLENCAASDDAAVFYVKPPASEGVLNRVLRYYLVDAPPPYAQLNTMGDLSAAENPATSGDYPQRVRDFIEPAAQVWYVQLESLPTVEQQTTFQSAVQRQYDRCFTLNTHDDLTSRLYTDDLDTGTCTLDLTPCTELPDDE